MEVNNVKFGNYSTGSFGATKKEYREKKDENQQLQGLKAEFLSVNPEEITDAMALSGLQNQILVNRAKVEEINPADYLSEGRIADIEALMEGFEKNTDLFAKEFQELGFSEVASNALGAAAFAKNINNAEVILNQE